MLLIKNCNLIDMNTIYKEKRDILINNKTIIEVSENIESKKEYDVIDAEMRLVTPGLIESHCHMSVYDTGNESGIDGNEISNPVIPGLKGLDALNPIDICFYTSRKHGVTTIVTGPGSSNIMGGMFVALKTSDEKLENRIIKEEDAIKMAVGENPKSAYGNKGKEPKTRMGIAALMREELFKAKEYYNKKKKYNESKNIKDKPKFDLNLESLSKAFDGLRVKIHAHEPYDIITAIRVAEEFGIRYSIEHVTGAEHVIDYLKSHNVECVAGPSLGFKGKYEIKDKDFKLAGILEKKGILFSIATDHPVIPIEAILLQAILFIKHGATPEGILRALTINAAKLTDIENNVGSLEVGKDADLVIWEIPPFDTMHKVYKTIINGKVVYESVEESYEFDYKK